MREFDTIDGMKIVKGPPRPKPRQLIVRFYDDERADLALLDKAVKEANRGREPGNKVSREKLIKLVLAQALADPKFTLKIP